VCTREGEQAVLKWSSNKSWRLQVERAAPVIKQARAAGWPTPMWLAWGATPSGYPYQIQEFAFGHRAEVLDQRLAQAAVKVIHRQSGMRPQTEQDWSAYDWEVVFADKSNFLTTVAASAHAGRDFVDVLRDRTARFRDVRLPAVDLVHGDFNPGNILLVRDEVNAVIDAEAIGKGSRFHDLSTLLAFGTLWNGEAEGMSMLLEYASKFARPGELEITLAANLAALLAFLVNREADPTSAIHAATGLIHRLA
jgi:aminoglycoside phosphotransferase (APT) family kinase protein